MKKKENQNSIYKYEWDTTKNQIDSYITWYIYIVNLECRNDVFVLLVVYYLYTI